MRKWFIIVVIFLIVVLGGLWAMQRYMPSTDIFSLDLGDSMTTAKRIVIAHRGASGYLPEHTLEGKAMAHAMGVDFLEQDVALTKDDVPIVIHDPYLDDITNVAIVYPDRKGKNGRYNTTDFTWDELKHLSVHERIDLATGKAVFPKRFPLHKGTFRLHSLAEELEMIQGMNTATGRRVGIYTEIKDPAWHRAMGKDISAIVLGVLATYGYTSKSDNFYLQCFDFAELKRIRQDLQFNGKMVLLYSKNPDDGHGTDYAYLSTKEGLAEVAGVVDAIGPDYTMVLTAVADDGTLDISPLVADAHALNLKVHVYTVRNDHLLLGYKDPSALVHDLFFKVNVDGIFSDFPDTTVFTLHQGLATGSYDK